MFAPQMSTAVSRPKKNSTACLACKAAKRQHNNQPFNSTVWDEPERERERERERKRNVKLVVLPTPNVTLIQVEISEERLPSSELGM
jgi:hypothetical protein